jgi:hypothetical protein
MRGPWKPGAGLSGACRISLASDAHTPSRLAPIVQAFDPQSPPVRLRLQHGAEHAYCLSPRAVTEFLAEIAAEIAGQAIIQQLAEYERHVTPDMLGATGGDHFGPQCLDAVPPTGGAG